MRLKRRVSTYKENPINFIKYYHMGAVCCASNKPKHKRQDVYQDTQTGNIHPTIKSQVNHEINNGNTGNNMNIVINEPFNQHNKVFNVNDGHEKDMDEGFKETSHVTGMFGRDHDHSYNHAIRDVKDSWRVPQIDQLDKSRSLALFPGISNPYNQNNVSYSGLDHTTNFQGASDNVFEPTFEDKKSFMEDYYYNVDEKYVKEHEDFFANSKQNKSKNFEQGNFGGSKSQLLDWSNLIQTQLLQEKSTMGASDNKNKLQKAYRTLITLDERNWYEEMVALYKEKQAMSKTRANITGLTIDRKLIQLQEQFRWLIAAIGNTRLNPNHTVGVHEFPPFKTSTRTKRGDRSETSLMSSGVRGPGSVQGSDETSDIFSPKKNQMNNTGSPPIKNNDSSKPENVFQSHSNHFSDFPEILSSSWEEGFLWKGVYLKLYSKNDAQSLKKELKVLKHLGIEYLQTETSMRITDNMHSISLNPNESLEGLRVNNGPILSVILPLICTVEGSSWVLLGTPIFPVKTKPAEDHMLRLSHEVNNMFRNTFLLSNMNIKNFKVYNKLEDGQQKVAHHSSSQNNNSFLLLSNVGKSIASLPKENILMVINQDPNVPISFLEYPQRGFDVNLIKKALGLIDEDIGTDNLLPGKRAPKIVHDFSFDTLRFKRRGWHLQIVHVVGSHRPLPSNMVINKRAMSFLSNSNKKRTAEIRGNVLIYGSLLNTDTIIHPYFISEQLFPSNFLEETPLMGEVLEKKDSVYKLSKLGGNSSGIHLRPRILSQPGEGPSFLGRENPLKSSFRQERDLREERILHEHFLINLNRSIESIIDQLDNTDAIVNFAGLKELFHRKGVNMRFEWIVYIKVKSQRAKTLIGADILARCLKRMLNDKTSKRFRSFRKQAKVNYPDPSVQKRLEDEITENKMEFYLENYFKKILCMYINSLIKDSSESQDYDEHNNFIFQELNTDLFLHRTRIMKFAKKSLDPRSFDYYLSPDIIKTLINLPCFNASTFLDAVSYHMKVCINYDILRQFRTDKYVNWIIKQSFVIKPSDLNILFANESYLTVAERCYMFLIKSLPPSHAHPSTNSNSIELILPSSLYKIQRGGFGDHEPFDCYLREYYELPHIEVLNDWIVLLESSLNTLYTPESHQNLLIEAYIIQMVLAFFGERDGENQLSLSILEKINALANNSPVTSPELTVAIHTWSGILSETKLFTQCEQSYAIALMALHKLNGDPRGRGGKGTPWELFISWRLSILFRLQGKSHDAEYSEEMYDATLLTLQDNPMNTHLKSHYIYDDPLRAYTYSHSNSNQAEISHLVNKPNMRNLQAKAHPFPHWTNHLMFDETCSKIDTLNLTLQKTPQLLKWMLAYIPTSQPSSGILWDTENLRDFFLLVMQDSFNNTSVSSVSNYSTERGRDRSSLDMSQGMKISNLKVDKKERKLNLGGNFVRIFEKDTSTFNKKEINGTVYTWGQNEKGQMGTHPGNIEEIGITTKKKTRIFYPKRLITLKDTIIVSVACGSFHSMAITLNGQLLAWGDNKFSQLGLGSIAPAEVFTPTLVSNLTDVSKVSCGHEHTVALTREGYVYSWGNGEEGLLGHENNKVQQVPKRIEALKNLSIQSVVCGGLHTLALTKEGHVYAWGKGEGGQLGLPINQLTHDTSKNTLYLSQPKRIKSALDGKNIIQIACGDAHSIALDYNGHVYGWGYTYYGQLGLGIAHENVEANFSCQIPEPRLIEKLTNQRIIDIYAGATFSFFLNDKNELYGCGLNESNQIGLEKSITKISNQVSRYEPNSPMESTFPQKLECFTSMPVVQVACGEAHSLALVVCDSSYILFSWGIQKQGQLGLGDAQISNSTPRPVSFLQYVMPYSMSCGANHSMVVLGDPTKTFKKEALIERLEKKPRDLWGSLFHETRDSYESAIDALLNRYHR